MDANRVFIFDTTLRDGEQSPGFHLNATAKLRIARQLEKLGVDVIEAGHPSLSAAEFDACRRVAREIRGATITALARADREEIDAVWSAIKEAEKPQIHVVLPASDLHIEGKLGMTREEVLKTGREMIAYARSLCDVVQYSAEDAGRADLDFLVECAEAMIEAGASVVNLADTTGYCLPTEFGELVEHVIKHARGADRALVSVHCHNDLGLATANSKDGLLAGARRVECTINGIGERAGNTSLEEIVMLLKVRGDRLGLETGVDTKEIMRTSRLVAELTGTPVQPNKAVVGANAFAHGGALQQEGVLKDRKSYLIMQPEDVGLGEARIALTARSSRSAFRHRLARLGLKPSQAVEDAAWDRFQRLAETKREVSDEDLEKIITAVESNGHGKALADAGGDDAQVADALRHLIFG
ncbi:MAG TPA: 2-isopropylmalate synthase [Candidatus Dormibacteraeota bacterium]|nr:2-isopropylmalate synthase [Candidatus Dormibacteraeota bacterium]